VEHTYYCLGDWVKNATYEDGKVTTESMEAIMDKVKSTAEEDYW